MVDDERSSEVEYSDVPNERTKQSLGNLEKVLLQHQTTFPVSTSDMLLLIQDATGVSTQDSYHLLGHVREYRIIDIGKVGHARQGRLQFSADNLRQFAALADTLTTRKAANGFVDWIGFVDETRKNLGGNFVSLGIRGEEDA